MTRTKQARSFDEIAFDDAVGERIRSIRIVQGLTQSDLGNRIGVTFQQLQKYERGTNRVSASRLALIANALNVRAADLMGEGRSIMPVVGRISPDLLALVERYQSCSKSGRAMIHQMVEAVLEAERLLGAVPTRGDLNSGLK